MQGDWSDQSPEESGSAKADGIVEPPWLERVVVVVGVGVGG